MLFLFEGKREKMNIDRVIELSLEEDLWSGDITTDNLGIENKISSSYLVAKENGILAGIEIAKKVFKKIDETVNFKALKKDGDKLFAGDKIAEISGKSVSILKAERVALNFLQRMSGIATLTNEFVKRIAPFKAKLLDTRKTTPMLREFEKYAVRIGGGYSHRFGLYDMVMLKENHIRAVGSISKAVERIKKNIFSYKIEVEVTNLKELEEAAQCGVDRIMLDNMSLSEMRKAVEKFSGKVELEASGNVTLKTIGKIAETGVDFISSGSLTHSYKSFDISLLFEERK